MTITHDLLTSVVWASIERIRNILGWSHEEMSEHLYLTSKEYFQLKTSKKDVPVHSILFLAEELQLDAENLSFGRLDYEAFQKQRDKNSLYLPERYSRGAFSKRRFFLPILELSDMQLGENLTDLFLRKFQINRLVFSQPDEAISLLFAMDVSRFFIHLGHPPTLLFRMGAYFANEHQDDLVKKTLRQCATVENAYSTLVNSLMRHLDLNLNYSIVHSNSTSCLIKTEENPEALDELKAKHLGNIHTCLYLSGLLSSIPTFLKLPFASSFETHCVHQGDLYCQFAVNFEYASAVHKKKLKKLEP